MEASSVLLHGPILTQKLVLKFVELFQFLVVSVNGWIIELQVWILIKLASNHIILRLFLKLHHEFTMLLIILARGAVMVSFGIQMTPVRDWWLSATQILKYTPDLILLFLLLLFLLFLLFDFSSNPVNFVLPDHFPDHFEMLVDGGLDLEDPPLEKIEILLHLLVRKLGKVAQLFKMDSNRRLLDLLVQRRRRRHYFIVQAPDLEEFANVMQLGLRLLVELFETGNVELHVDVLAVEWPLEYVLILLHFQFLLADLLLR